MTTFTTDPAPIYERRAVKNNQEVANSVQVLMKPRKKVTASTGVERGKVVPNEG